MLRICRSSGELGTFHRTIPQSLRDSSLCTREPWVRVPLRRNHRTCYCKRSFCGGIKGMTESLPILFVKPGWISPISISPYPISCIIRKRTRHMVPCPFPNSGKAPISDSLQRHSGFQLSGISGFSSYVRRRSAPRRHRSGQYPLRRTADSPCRRSGAERSLFC